jgi:hypothetical protein
MIFFMEKEALSIDETGLNSGRKRAAMTGLRKFQFRKRANPPDFLAKLPRPG